MKNVFNCNHGSVDSGMFEPDGIEELVRGNEARMVERLLPVVSAQNVTIDLHRVKRIDAAGLAALIKLYCAARDSGHTFAVSNPSAHVAEILTLVGLDKLFVSRNANEDLYIGINLQESAA